MLRIQKGKTVLTVTKGAFNSLYRKYGWKLESDAAVEEPKPVVLEEIPEEETAEEPEEETIVEDSEAVTPLSEMSLKELKAFAKEHNIDISGATKAPDIRGIIEAETEE